MATEFSTNKPELLSVGIETDSTATLVWACDTTNVFGYRLYNSFDGVKWNLAMNESTLHNKFISVPLKIHLRCFALQVCFVVILRSKVIGRMHLALGIFPKQNEF